LIRKYEIFFGDQNDRVLARFSWLYGSGVKVLITFNAPTSMCGVFFNRQHRPGTIAPEEIFVTG
jgi:hypothetical protein